LVWVLWIEAASWNSTCVDRRRVSREECEPSSKEIIIYEVVFISSVEPWCGATGRCRG
jgi:hypothetical protein